LREIIMEVSKHARLVAGNTALRIFHACGAADIAAEYYKGVLTAFALALVALIGRERAYEVFAEAIHEFAPQRSAPKLVSKDGDRVA
jgi:hypothetical protein